MASAVLNWTPNTEVDLASYRVYRKVGTGAFIVIATVLKGSNSYTDDPLPLVDADITYNLTAVDTSGNESAHSVNVVRTVNLIPPVAPVGLTVVIA